MNINEYDQEIIKQVASVLKNQQRILFITGAGISAESGLPTYRGIGGLYENNLTHDGLSIEEALSGEVLRRTPELTWKYLSQIEQSCRNATFNDAHRIIAQMEQRFQEVWVLTQNVDGFHHDAGSSNVIDIHGDLHDLECMQCTYNTHVTDYSELQIPPVCPQCHGMVRPQVVLFGEMLPQDKTTQLIQELQEGFDMVFTIGTTSVFPYIAHPIVQAKQRGVPTVEINPGDTHVSRIVDYKIKGGAAKSLTAIWDYLQPC